jgi:hypothetical protein
MQTMRREGLADVLTNDKHFEQEGFRALFRDRFVIRSTRLSLERRSMSRTLNLLAR